MAGQFHHDLVLRPRPQLEETPSTKPQSLLLKKIPEEILVKIVSHLDDEDLLDTRETCKALERATFDRFVSFCFSSRTFSSGPQSDQKEREFLSKLRGCEQIGRQVRTLSKSFLTSFSANVSPRSEGVQRFADIVGSSPGLKHLKVDWMSRGGIAAEEIVEALIIPLKNTRNLSRLGIGHSILSASTLETLLKAIPSLKHLEMSHCACVEGWVEGLAAVAKSDNLIKVELGTLFAGNGEGLLFNLCGEQGEFYHLEHESSGVSKVKCFRNEEGQLQQYALNTCRNSFFFGNTGLKAGVRFIVSNYVSDAGLARLGLDKVDSNGKVMTA